MWLVVNALRTEGSLPMAQAWQILWPLVPNSPEPEAAVALEVELELLEEVVLEAALVEAGVVVAARA